MKKVLLFCLLAASFSAFAWDGYDYDKGTYIEIDKGNVVRQGNDIEYYDYSAGEYRTGEVQSIEESGSSVDVEVQDSETGEIRTFEMEQ